MSAELEDAIAFIRANAARELRAGKRHIHKNANRHRRELGLLVEPNLDDFREMTQAVFSAYSMAIKKMAAALLPATKQLMSMAEQIDEQTPASSGADREKA